MATTSGIFFEPTHEEIERRNSTFSVVCGEGMVRHFRKVEDVPERDNILNMNVEDAVEHIKSVILGSNFSSKKMGFCYFTEEYFEDDEIYDAYLLGCYNTHNVPGGCIQYHKDYQIFMECASIQHMVNNKMLYIDYLASVFPEEILIPRTRRPEDTKDRFSKGRIISNSATVYSRRENTLNIFVEFMDNGYQFFKTVRLKTLMEKNSISQLSIKPKIFNEEYISQETPKTSAILTHYNTMFKNFVKDTICPQLDKEEISYDLSFDYLEF